MMLAMVNVEKLTDMVVKEWYEISSWRFACGDVPCCHTSAPLVHLSFLQNISDKCQMVTLCESCLMWAYAHWAWASKIIISSSPVIQHVVACLVKLGKCNLHLESENILFSKISFCSHLRHWSHLYIFCTCSAVRFLQIFWNSCKEKMIMLSLFMALTMKFSASSCLRCTGFVFFFQVSVPSPLLWPHRPHSCPYSWTAFQLYFPDNLFPGMGWGTICTQNLGIARKGGGSAPCQDLFGGFVHNALRAVQSDHLSKVIISPQKSALIPQYR